MVVQTHSPDDPSIRFASRHDYLGFAKAELADRKALGYPPFSRIVRVLIEGASEDDVAARSTELAGALRALPEDVGAQIMGPVPAPIARIKGRFRYHVLTKLPRDGDITHVTAMLSGMRSRRGKASVSIDVDPMNML